MPNGSAFRRWGAIRNYPAEPLCCNLPTDWLGTFPPFAWDHPPFEGVLVFDIGKQIKRICFAVLTPQTSQEGLLCRFTPQTNQKDLLCLTTDHAGMMPRQTPHGEIFLATSNEINHLQKGLSPRETSVVGGGAWGGVVAEPCLPLVRRRAIGHAKHGQSGWGWCFLGLCYPHRLTACRLPPHKGEANPKVA